MKNQEFVKLTIDFFKEGKDFIAYCPSLDLSAHGSTVERAKKAFEDTFSLFVEELKQNGKLKEVLIECGWTRIPKTRKNNSKSGSWVPPARVGNISEDFAIPV